MKKRSHLSGWLLRLMRLWFVSALVITSVTPWWASAQSADDPWAVPLNLSHSGAAKNPAIVIDSDAVVHAVWQDAFANFVYTRLEDGQWSAPQPTSLHTRFRLPGSQAATGQTEVPLYAGPNPIFMAGPSRYIFAFWISQRGSLYTSRVLNRNFKDAAAWTTGQFLSSSVASFAASVDVRGVLHLAYLRATDVSGNPAGLYYTRTRNGVDWAAPVLLYESPYFRGLGGGAANLSLATAGTADAPLVYAAWDNRPRKQVFLAKSADGGASWEQPVQIAGPVPDSGLSRPYNIRVGAAENSAVLVWQSGKPEEACTQFYQFSQDAGATWSQAQLMLGELSGCAQANEFVTGLASSPGGLVYLTTNIQSQIFLSAWNGSQWSEPQAQPILSGFDDLEIYSQVDYDCHRTTLFGQRLYVIGCDQGGGGDIWVTSRDLASSRFEFSPPVWGRPAPITGDAQEWAATELVATGDGLIHAFFSRRHDPAIYYTRWDGARWSLITPALQLPDGDAGWPAIAAGPGNELFLITQSSKGSLYFSQSNSSNAVKTSGWSTPTRLRITHDGRAGPADVVWDASGAVNVAYSVPVNDERGIYLVKSKDQGKTWSEPLQVFNGVAAGFELVGSPSLLVSANGLVHAIWKQQSIQADGVSQPLSLYYARSEDAGGTFSKAELVVEAPVAWREIVADGKGNLHRLWQRADRLTSLWDQVSVDGGRSWQVAQRLPVEGGAAAVTVDIAGRLHLLSAGEGTLAHWLWDESRWQAEVPLHWALASQPAGPVELLAAVVNRAGKMVAVLVLPTGTDGSAERLLLHTTRTLNLPPRPTAIQETSTPLPPSPTVTPTTPTPKPSPTLTATAGIGSVGVQDPQDRGTASDPVTQFAITLLPVALVLLTILGIVILRAFRVKAR